MIGRITRNRFNRPIPNEQIHHTIAQLLEGADKRAESDPHTSDLLYKSMHLMKILWRECLMHDILAEEALHRLQDVEAHLKTCIEREEKLASAKLALDEVRGLRVAIEKPTDSHATWHPYDEKE